MFFHRPRSIARATAGAITVEKIVILAVFVFVAAGGVKVLGQATKDKLVCMAGYVQQDFAGQARCVPANGLPPPPPIPAISKAVTNVPFTNNVELPPPNPPDECIADGKDTACTSTPVTGPPQHCPDGSNLVGSQCLAGCPSGQTVSGDSTSCVEGCATDGGYYQSGNGCKRDLKVFPSNNSSCPAGDKCGLTFNKGCSKCPPLAINNGCLCRWDADYYTPKSTPRNSTAPDCGPNGQQTPGASTCTTCSAPYVLSGNQCVFGCPAGSFSINNACVPSNQVPGCEGGISNGKGNCCRAPDVANNLGTCCTPPLIPQDHACIQKTCGPGQQPGPNNTCVNNPCQPPLIFKDGACQAPNLQCPQGTVPDATQTNCITDPRVTPQCQPPLVFKNGGCQAPNLQCPVGTKPNPDQTACIPDPRVVPQCQPPLVFKNGGCQAPNLQCPPYTKPDPTQTSCIDDPNYHPCPAAQHWDGQACVND